MPRPRDWKLVFTCPACCKAGELAVVNLTAVVHCPYCRTKVVIDKDGMRKAGKRTGRSPPQKREPPPQYNSRRPAPLASGKLGRLWAGSMSVLLIAVPGIFLWNRQPASDDERALRLAAQAFQSAWLEQDFDTVASFVLSSDRDLLTEWSAPRRAALVAGFGAEFRGKVTSVQIVENDVENTIVCVAFQIRGREQQAFQAWRLEEGNWRVCLGQAQQP